MNPTEKDILEYIKDMAIWKKPVEDYKEEYAKYMSDFRERAAAYEQGWPDAFKESKQTPKKVKQHNHKAIAEKVMRELARNHLEDFVILQNDDVREWWTEIIEEDKRKAAEIAAKEAAREAREEKARRKAEILSRLTDEEKKILGVK